MLIVFTFIFSLDLMKSCIKVKGKNANPGVLTPNQQASAKAPKP